MARPVLDRNPGLICAAQRLSWDQKIISAAKGDFSAAINLHDAFPHPSLNEMYPLGPSSFILHPLSGHWPLITPCPWAPALHDSRTMNPAPRQASRCRPSCQRHPCVPAGKTGLEAGKRGGACLGIEQRSCRSTSRCWDPCKRGSHRRAIRQPNPQHALSGLTPVPTATTNSVISYCFDQDCGCGFRTALHLRKNRRAKFPAGYTGPNPLRPVKSG